MATKLRYMYSLFQSLAEWVENNYTSEGKWPGRALGPRRPIMTRGRTPNVSSGWRGRVVLPREKHLALSTTVDGSWEPQRCAAAHTRGEAVFQRAQEESSNAGALSDPCNIGAPRRRWQYCARSHESERRTLSWRRRERIRSCAMRDTRATHYAGRRGEIAQVGPARNDSSHRQIQICYPLLLAAHTHMLVLLLKDLRARVTRI